jgi:hypothetical protein
MTNGVLVVHDWVSWKRGERDTAEPETVTIIDRAYIRKVLNTRTRSETTAILRQLRDDGRLVHRPRGLQNVVRNPDGTKRMAYVIRGTDVPRMQRTDQGRVQAIITV